MNFLDQDDFNPKSKDPLAHDHHNDMIHEYYLKGIEMVRGGKLFGLSIDTSDYEEVIAALYVAYLFKEHMVKVDV